MFNKVILMGRLTKDPELRYTSTSIPVCSFTIAVDRKFIRQGEQRQADFFNIVAWQKTAEFVSKYFTKGRPIIVCGRLETRTWDDQEGKRHYATEVIADEASFVEGKRENEGNDNVPGAPAMNRNIAGNGEAAFRDNGDFTPIDQDDDLPF